MGVVGGADRARAPPPSPRRRPSTSSPRCCRSYLAQSGYRAPLGATRVIFGPQAIGELCELALMGGFYGRGWEEGRAFTAGKSFGERLFSPQVTLRDDPEAAQVFGMPFDMKGKRRRHSRWWKRASSAG